MIPFNRQNLFGDEFEYVKDSYATGKISGDGKYSKLCTELMESKFGAKKILLTPSCTHALELAMLLLKIGPGDEVIMPSYTFVTTANSVVLRGGKPIFCDIRSDNLNIDENEIESLITERTKAIMPVHYAGVACEMDKIMSISKEYGIPVVEDAAQAVNAKYKGRHLGTIGHIGCYSFHETKNYSMGEGGAIVLNDESYIDNCEILREKGTNRSRFFRGDVDKYSWVDVGSSYLPSDISACFLWSQLSRMDEIHNKRREIWMRYHNALNPLKDSLDFQIPNVEMCSESNYHIFYVIMKTETQRDNLISFFRENGVYAPFHYVPLHQSDYYVNKWGHLSLPATETYSSRLVRLPIFYSITSDEIDKIINIFIKWTGTNPR